MIAPFNGRPIRFNDATVVPTVAGGAYVFRVAQAGRPERLFRVTGVVGGGHMLGGGTQGYLTPFPDGTVRVLPFEFIRREAVWFCNTNSRKNRGWLPITPELALADCGDWPPARVFGDVARYANCQACHGSQIQVAFDPRTRRYNTRWQTLAVNCESCHGPGRRHVDIARSGGITRATDIGMRALATLSKDEALDVCYQCHALKDVLAGGYLPGAGLQAHYALKFALLGDRPLFADGRVRTFAYQENQRFSDCYLNGSMTCVDCHDPHSQGYRDISGRPLASPTSDGQCVDCHSSKAEPIAAHTHHAPDSPGSRCVSCHMPYLQEPEIGGTLRYARSDHTIPIPRPAFDSGLGVENACRQCHAERTSQGLERQLVEWYGETKPRNATVARLLRGLRETRPTAAAELLLVPDPRHPMAVFAGAGDFLERFLEPDMPRLEAAVAERLERLARSDDIDVRGLALASLHLARGEDPQVRGFLADRLSRLDPATDDLVRRRWVLALGFVADGYRLRDESPRAVVVYRKALEVRPDDPGVLLNLGLTYAALGEPDSAVASYRRSLAANPDQALAHVNWGLALQSQGDTAGAIAQFRRALDLDPSEPLAYFDLANIALVRGQPAEAAEGYRRALALDPSLAPGHFYLARALILLGRYAEAYRAVRTGLEFDPQNASALQMRADLERAIGERP